MEYFALLIELHQKKFGQTVKLMELSFDAFGENIQCYEKRKKTINKVCPILTASVFIVDVDLYKELNVCKSTYLILKG